MGWLIYGVRGGMRVGPSSVGTGSVFAGRAAGRPIWVCVLSRYLPCFMLQLFQKLIYAKCK